MTRQQHIAIWSFIVILFGLALMALSSVLLPFVAAMAVAYLLDPLADRLVLRGMSRTVATTLITGVFFLVALLLVLLLVPVLISQLTGFVGRLPGYVESFRENLLPNLMDLARDLGIPLRIDLKAALSQHAGEAAGVLGKLIGGLVGGGQVVLSLVSLLVVTPVVSFYLLRDWDQMIATVDNNLPRRQAEAIREQARKIDGVLAGFVRGQMMVCLALGSFYGLGLSLVGLDFGLVIGLGAGMISFIPYVGTILGFVVSMGVALVQFSPDWVWIGVVALVFGIGQFIEGNFLTPKLVGDRVGLHPVWVMFGLFAGGALFGFVGMLIAVPVCAVIGVLTRFALDRYRQSVLYHGGEPPSDNPA